MNVLRRQIQEMLDKGIIRYSVSPYSNPIFLVPKGETDFRPVVDYRALNEKIVIETVPLLDIHSCFHWFAGATVFTTLDLNSAKFLYRKDLASVPRLLQTGTCSNSVASLSGSLLGRRF
jgi:hypothetical protein